MSSPPLSSKLQRNFNEHLYATTKLMILDEAHKGSSKSAAGAFRNLITQVQAISSIKIQGCSAFGTTLSCLAEGACYVAGPSDPQFQKLVAECVAAGNPEREDSPAYLLKLQTLEQGNAALRQLKSAAAPKRRQRLSGRALPTCHARLNFKRGPTIHNPLPPAHATAPPPPQGVCARSRARAAARRWLSLLLCAGGVGGEAPL
jgi:hypothetical protein